MLKCTQLWNSSCLAESSPPTKASDVGIALGYITEPNLVFVGLKCLAQMSQDSARAASFQSLCTRHLHIPQTPTLSRPIPSLLWTEPLLPQQNNNFGCTNLCWEEGYGFFLIQCPSFTHHHSVCLSFCLAVHFCLLMILQHSRREESVLSFRGWTGAQWVLPGAAAHRRLWMIIRGATGIHLISLK